MSFESRHHHFIVNSAIFPCLLIVGCPNTTSTIKYSCATPDYYREARLGERVDACYAEKSLARATRSGNEITINESPFQTTFYLDDSESLIAKQLLHKTKECINLLGRHEASTQIEGTAMGLCDSVRQPKEQDDPKSHFAPKKVSKRMQPLVEMLCADAASSAGERTLSKTYYNSIWPMLDSETIRVSIASDETISWEREEVRSISLVTWTLIGYGGMLVGHPPWGK